MEFIIYMYLQSSFIQYFLCSNSFLQVHEIMLIRVKCSQQIVSIFKNELLAELTTPGHAVDWHPIKLCSKNSMWLYLITCMISDVPPDICGGVK